MAKKTVAVAAEVSNSVNARRLHLPAYYDAGQSAISHILPNTCRLGKGVRSPLGSFHGVEIAR